MNTQIEKIVNEINKGGNWNGKFYTDRKGKITVYVSSKLFLVGEVKWGGEERKEELLNAVSGKNENKNEWLVDGVKTSNSLNYSEMYSKYGMDFE